jgi:hypothetical protein
MRDLMCATSYRRSLRASDVRSISCVDKSIGLSTAPGIIVG